ncbi:MAG: GDP-mannose 4,6-dehydratase [Clostridiaceae bacterium]|nr:GDP-mannose 4,6-dehydratase [Clostridiaceae bacterium]
MNMINQEICVAKKILVVGAAGFVGKHLLRFLSSMPHLAISATKLTGEIIDADEFRHVDVYDLDITSAMETKSLFRQIMPDYLVLLAAQSSVGLSFAKPDLTMQINLIGSIHVMEAIRDVCPLCKLLLVGSSEQYGRVISDQLPIRESASSEPVSPYAVSKAAAEAMARIHVRSYQAPIIMVRAFNHIGPGQLPIFVVSDFAHQIALIETNQAEPIMKVGDLSARRDFTDVRDIVRGYYQLLLSGHPGEVYNIGSGISVMIQAILDQLLSFSKTRIQVVVDPAKLRPIEIPEIRADISKIQKDTAWQPTISLEQSLQDTLDYWRSHI